MSPEKQAVLATLDEIAATQRAIGLGPEPDELAEAWFIVEQIERKLAQKREEEATAL